MVYIPLAYVIPWHQEPDDVQDPDFILKACPRTTAREVKAMITQRHPRLNSMDFIAITLRSPIGAFLLKTETISDIKRIYATSYIRIKHELPAVI